jgi:hypothetical protein
VKVGGSSGCYRLEDWEAFLRGAGADMPRELEEAVTNWMTQTSPLPGRRGTGYYSDYQIRLFDDIAQGLSNHKPVTAGTVKTVAPRSKRIPKDADLGGGRALSGLLPDHAYSVLDVEIRDSLRWLKMENPWKKWGVKYDYGTYDSGPKIGRKWMKPVFDPNLGEFWLELTDFCKRYKEIYIGGVPLI